MTLAEDERVNSKSERITKTELRETTFKREKIQGQRQHNVSLQKSQILYRPESCTDKVYKDTNFIM